MSAPASHERRQNVELARGINAIAANSLAKTNGRRAPPREKAAEEAGTTANTSQSFSTRKWYPADYIPKKLPSAKTARNSKKTARLRKSITPGTVLILLSGRFRGKRVVFLKQLASGTLLVTGPYKVNGVPLRRVNQAFVIATSTKVDLDGVELPQIDDDYFVKDKKAGGARKGGKEGAFFAQDASEVSGHAFGINMLLVRAVVSAWDRSRCKFLSSNTVFGAGVVTAGTDGERAAQAGPEGGGRSHHAQARGRPLPDGLSERQVHAHQERPRSRAALLDGWLHLRYVGEI